MIILFVVVSRKEIFHYSLSLWFSDVCVCVCITYSLVARYWSCVSERHSLLHTSTRCVTNLCACLPPHVVLQISVLAYMTSISKYDSTLCVNSKVCVHCPESSVL